MYVLEPVLSIQSRHKLERICKFISTMEIAAGDIIKLLSDSDAGGGGGGGGRLSL